MAKDRKDEVEKRAAEEAGERYDEVYKAARAGYDKIETFNIHQFGPNPPAFSW